jgi:nucleoid DNA-binding protein
MNKKQLIRALAATTHFETQKVAGEFLNEFLKIITDSVAAGNEVRITDFGKFEAYKLANGKTTPKFRPFKSLKDKVA